MPAFDDERKVIRFEDYRPTTAGFVYEAEPRLRRALSDAELLIVASACGGVVVIFLLALLWVLS